MLVSKCLTAGCLAGGIVIGIVLVVNSDGDAKPLKSAHIVTAEQKGIEVLPEPQTSVPRDREDIQLTVEVTGIQKTAGSLKVAIFSGESGFPDHRNALHRVSVAVEGSTGSVVLPPLPFGHYAIAVYHDADNNDQLNRAAFGYPTEAYGFSNNARSAIGPPEYASAEFVADAGRKTVPIVIR